MKTKLILLFGVCFLFFTIPTIAQEESDALSTEEKEESDSLRSEEKDGPDPPPPAPASIDNCIPLLIIAGIVFGFRKINHKTKIINFK